MRSTRRTRLTGEGEAQRSPVLDDAAQYAGARTIALRLLTAAPRSRAQLAEALARKGVRDDIAEAVLDRLSEVRLIDDAEFAQMWVRSRSTTGRRGKQVLAQELRTKGIADDLAADALDTYDDETEEATARHLAASRVRQLRGHPPEVQLRRLAGLLQRRGFGSGTALRVARETVGELADDHIDLEASGADEEDISDEEGIREGEGAGDEEDTRNLPATGSSGRS